MNGRLVASAAFTLVVLGGAWMFRYDAKDPGYGTLLVCAAPISCLDIEPASVGDDEMERLSVGGVALRSNS